MTRCKICDWIRTGKKVYEDEDIVVLEECPMCHVPAAYIKECRPVAHDFERAMMDKMLRKHFGLKGNIKAARYTFKHFHVHLRGDN